MRALLWLPECCTVPICLVLLGLAVLRALLAGDRQQSREIWAEVRQALKFIAKGGT